MSFNERVEELVDHFERLMHHFMHRRTLQQDDCCPFDIGRQEFSIICCLGKKGECRMTDIADSANLSLSSVTAVVDKLESKNLVRRDRSNEDRRVVSVLLTQPGEQVYRLARDARLQMGRGMLQPLTEEEQTQLVSLFRKVAGHLANAKE